jgi:hypothetical protein
MLLISNLFGASFSMIYTLNLAQQQQVEVCN